jgi:hypothetical protein
MAGFMNYAVEMGSDAMIHIQSFFKDWFRHSKVDWGGYADTEGDRISVL